MIIDCHGHYTTTPPELGEYREQQKADLAKDPLHQHIKGLIGISDDQIRDSLTGAQLKLQRERGTDLTTDYFVDACIRFIDQGASIIGGCCGIGPEDISAFSAALDNKSH